MKSNLILFVLGLLLCTTSSFADEIVLTKNNHIVFSGVVEDSSVAQAQIQLNKLSKNLPTGAVIYLVLDTPGGSVSAGNLFIDYAKSLPQQIKPICIFCASMGYHFFQSFGERIVYASSTLMSHRARLGGMGGQVPGELESRLTSIKRVLTIMDTSAAKRIGITTEAYQKLIYDELWLDGTTAVQMNHADRIAKIRCSEDLANGTKNEIVNTLFGPVKVTFSTCPLINGILDAELARDSKFRSKNEALTHVRAARRFVSWGY